VSLALSPLPACHGWAKLASTEQSQSTGGHEVADNLEAK
jgi:hypothetical protein